jgi:hypothetical protein
MQEARQPGARQMDEAQTDQLQLQLLESQVRSPGESGHSSRPPACGLNLVQVSSVEFVGEHLSNSTGTGQDDHGGSR